VFGGASALLGVATRLGALAVLVTQGVAVAKVHASKGFNNLAGGWEFNLALMAMAAGLLVAGPGVLSGHELVERRLQRQPLAWLMRPRRTGAALRAVKLLK
jgi:putative oxidoreductase